jgi:hypothetical protein
MEGFIICTLYELGWSIKKAEIGSACRTLGIGDILTLKTGRKIKE